MKLRSTLSPFRELEEMQRKLERSLAPMLPKASFRPEEAELSELMGTGEWYPEVDITENDKEYLIKSELPEVKMENVHITVENGILHLRGERKLEKEEKGLRHLRIERAYGSFRRSFTLPSDADPAKVKAEFKDGLMTIHIEKSEQAKPRVIDIKVG